MVPRRSMATSAGRRLLVVPARAIGLRWRLESILSGVVSASLYSWSEQQGADGYSDAFLLLRGSDGLADLVCGTAVLALSRTHNIGRSRSVIAHLGISCFVHSQILVKHPHFLPFCPALPSMCLSMFCSSHPLAASISAHNLMTGA